MGWCLTSGEGELEVTVCLVGNRYSFIRRDLRELKLHWVQNDLLGSLVGVFGVALEEGSLISSSFENCAFIALVLSGFIVDLMKGYSFQLNRYLLVCTLVIVMAASEACDYQFEGWYSPWYWCGIE